MFPGKGNGCLRPACISEENFSSVQREFRRGLLGWRRFSMNADSSAARVSFKLPVGGGFLNASATLPGGHTTLTQLLPVIQNLENAIVARVGEEAEQAGSPISCRAGCGACCRQMVPVSFFEADALAHWFEALPENRRAELERRFHSALLALREAGVIENLVSDGWTADEESATRLAIDYFHAGVACPFLENESCSIHPIRPLSCREYLVTSPPDLCSDPSVNQVAGVQLPSSSLACFSPLDSGSHRTGPAGCL